MTKSRNPNWTRDELILALDFYLKHAPVIPDNQSDEIGELSSLLNRLHSDDFKVEPNSFRNRNGVHMKMMNFRRIDPTYFGKGLERGNRLEEEVWNKFADKNVDLQKTASNIRESIAAGEVLSSEVDSEDDSEAEEGRILTKVHRSRERNTKLVNRKKNSVLKSTGKLECEVCGFDFAVTYAERGEGFIECHHTKPVSELKPGQKTSLKELMLVCSNCHRMIHRRRPWLSASELQAVM